MLHDGPALQLAGLDDGTAGDEPDETGSEPLGKLGDDGVLERFVAVAVADDAGEAGVAAPREPLDGPRDVVCRVDAHEAAGADEVDLLCKPLADGHGKASAHDVAEHVVDGDVDVVGLKGFQVF